MIPKDWSQVNLEQYSKLHPTLITKGMSDLERIDNKVKQISILTGLSLEEAENAPRTYLTDVVNLLKTPLPTKIHRRFRIGKQNYEFNIDANKLNQSGYVAIMNAVKDDPIKHLHVTMFNLARPIKASWLGWKQFEFKPHEVSERLNDFKLLPVSMAYPIAVFFLNLSKDLISGSGDYFNKLLTNEMKKLDEIKADLLSGDGQ